MAEPDLYVNFKLEPRLVGGHVHVKVRAKACAVELVSHQSRGLCGELVMTQDEWAMFEELVVLANLAVFRARANAVPMRVRQRRPGAPILAPATPAVEISDLVDETGQGSEAGADGPPIVDEEA